MTSHKPEDYSTVSPYLVVDGAAATIDFLTEVFDAVELRRFPDEDGRLMHAEVRIDDTVVMLADSVEEWPPFPSHVHVYVRDVDATYRRALEAGVGPGAGPEGGRGPARGGEGPRRHHLVDRHAGRVRVSPAPVIDTERRTG